MGKIKDIILLIIFLNCLLGSEDLKIRADAGKTIYTEGRDVVLNGSLSYGRDLKFSWSQVRGPEVLISDKHSVMPEITGLSGLGDSVSELVFSLRVISSDNLSDQAEVKVYYLPGRKSGEIKLLNPPFNPYKPTVFSFNGGDCVCSQSMDFLRSPFWLEKVNFFTASDCCPPYEDTGDQLLCLLNKYAPEYREIIQTFGFSTGGNPAAIIAAHLNKFKDERYFVNRVSLFDASCIDFNAETVKINSLQCKEERCWVENYRIGAPPVANALNVEFWEGNHGTPVSWYAHKSYSAEEWGGKGVFNNGICAGWYTSVAGPGKNLQINCSGTFYTFLKREKKDNGLEQKYPSDLSGRLPEPVKLKGPGNGATAGKDGVVLSCEPGENCISYQVLAGRSRNDLNVVLSENTLPPVRKVTDFPYPRTFWTVRTFDKNGSSVYGEVREILFPKAGSVPEIKITGIDNYNNVKGKVNIKIYAQDRAGIRGVYLFINGVLQGFTSNSELCYVLDTEVMPDIINYLEVRAYNNSGEITELHREFRVTNSSIYLKCTNYESRAWFVNKMYVKLDVKLEGKAGDLRRFEIFRELPDESCLLIDNVQNEKGLREFEYIDRSFLRNKEYLYWVKGFDGNDNLRVVSDKVLIKADPQS